MSTPRVCVIGAGPSGLATVKNLAEAGVENITCYERQDQLGGNWVFTLEKGHASVYRSTHIISSKKLSSFDDFPMPREYPDFPSHRQILKYFQDYADTFDLLKHIKFDHLVKSAKRLESGAWSITVEGPDGEATNIFDYLLLCSGHHWDPYTPEYPGEFTGTQMHSHDYRINDPFKDKKVLVVGGGNSACDIAVDTSRVSETTAISMRRGYYIVPKLVLGKPVDVIYRQLDPLPRRLRQIILQLGLKVLIGQYKRYGMLEPKAKVMEMHPTLNSEILYQVRHGNVDVRRGIKSFEGKTVHFKNGISEDYDTIVWATGYRNTFPFFDKEFIDWSEALEIPLYLKMMPADMENLYFIGLFQPIGCIWNLADLQAKIAARHITGSLKRPNNIQALVDDEVRSPHWAFEKTPRHAVEVDFHIFKRQLEKELSQSAG